MDMISSYLTVILTSVFGPFYDQRVIFGWCFLLISYLLTFYAFNPGNTEFNDESCQFYPLVKGYPFIRNLNLVFPLKRYHENLANMMNVYGPNYEFYLVKKRFVVITDSQLIHEVLGMRPTLLRRLKALDDALQIFDCFVNSLVFAEGSAWSRQRRLTVPSFSHKNVELMKTAIADELDTFLNSLKEISNGEEVQMNDKLFEFTIRVISSVAFGGLSGDAERYFCKSNDLRDDLKHMLELMLLRVSVPFPDWFWNLIYFFVGKPEGLIADERFTAYCKQVIIEKRKVINSIDDMNQLNGKPSMLETILRTNIIGEKTITDAEVLGNTKTFFLAGSDTTSVTLSWCLYHLSQNDTMITMIREEINEAFTLLSKENMIVGIKPSGIDFVAMASNLPYCNACFQEALRLGPPAFVLMGNTTSATEPVKLSNGLIIGVNDTIGCFVDGCMRDPTVYPEPTKYLPSRWLLESNPENSNQLKAMTKSFLAFGGGSRVCPGMALAKLEGVAALAGMICYFDFKLTCAADEITRDLLFICKPNKMPMTICKREF